jgi:phosphoglycolate phosphatase-like HAD superfamily hydrolase
VITAIIFDLDSCLSAADEAGAQLFQPAFDAISHANHGSHTPAILEQAFAEMWRVPFDTVAQKYCFTPSMRDAGWQALLPLEVRTPMSGYGDLSALQELPVKRFLVTSGFRRLQESKIRALGITPLFTAIYVNAIDEPTRHGKQGIIEGILRDHQLQPSQVLIVGDNPDSELGVGRGLGISTVQTLRPGVPYSAVETHHIHSLHELKDLIDPSRDPQRTSSAPPAST